MMNIVTLDQVCDFLDNQRKPVTAKNRKPGIYPYYGANGVKDYVDNYIFDDELVLLAEDGGFFDDPKRGVAYRVSGKCWVNNHAHVLKPKSNINVDYLGYVLHQYDVRPYITGAIVKKLNQSAARKIKIPLPPLSEQKNIIEKLTCSELLIKKRRKAIDLLDEYIKSVFIEMFGDPVLNPKKWETRTIEQLVKKERHAIKRGPFGGSLKKDIFVKSGYLVYEQFHALNNDFSMARYFIDDKKFDELKAFQVKEGDIIISCSGVYLGKLAIVPVGAKKGIINQALLKISLDNTKMNNILFSYIFSNKNFRNKYFANQIGSGIPNFPPMSEFKKFKFIYPPIELQNQFLIKVEKKENIKKKMLDQSKELENQFQALTQKYFTIN